MANWVCVDIRSTNSTTAWRKASLTKWARAQRVWIRILDQDSGHVVEQWTVGFIDARNTGPRSRAHRILEAARHIYQNTISSGKAGAKTKELRAIFCRPDGVRSLKEHLAQQKTSRHNHSGIDTTGASASQ